MTVEHLLRSLLSHLGVDHQLTTYTDRAGNARREHHLYAEPEVITEVLQFVVRADEKTPIRVFEGDPPPF